MMHLRRKSASKKSSKVKKIIAVVGLLILIVAGFWTWKYLPVSKAPKTSQPLGEQHYDVVVVGAGPGGIAASIQAARMGAHVALLEPTDWIGGQITAAGVGTMDEGNRAARSSGIYSEFVQRVEDYYAQKNKSVDTCYGPNSLCVDPQSGQVLLWQAIRAAGQNLHVYTRVTVTKVIKQGSTVVGVVANGTRFDSRVVIDADEYGDVIAQAGAAYRLGNGTSDDPASPDACVQSATYTAVIRQYPSGVPSQLQFKRPPPGYTPALVKHFASFVNSKPSLPGHPNSKSFKNFIAYRGIPDLTNPQDYDVFQKNGHTITRTSLNLSNDYPATGVLSTNFVSDNSFRQQSTCNAKLLTIQLLYYIQHDLGESSWSIANDEGYNTAYNQQHRCANLKGYEAFEDQMSQEPYVREARRLVGTETLTGQELQYSWSDQKNIPRYSDSIAVGYYPMDLHDCKTASTMEAQFDSPSDISPKFSGGPFEVPMGVMIPEKIDGLLAAEKNISTSRLANGAIREQPIAMDIGQAAGALAAIAARHNIQPRNVSPQEVQAALQAAHAVTTIPST